MAVVYINEITGRDGFQDADTNKRYRRTWIIRTSSPQDGASVVLTAPGLPAFNDIYTYVDDSNLLLPVSVVDNDAVMVDLQVTQDNGSDPQDWRVVAQYAGVADPVSQPADVEYSPTRYQKALVKDLDGFPVVNSADDPFESGILVDRTRNTLTIGRNKDVWDPIAMDAFQDSVNAVPFLVATHPPGFAMGTCKLTHSAKRIRRKGTNSFYWHVTYVIDIDKEGWKIKIRDAGFNELVYDPDTGEIVGSSPIFAAPGQPTTSPWPLKPDGTSVPKGGTIPDPLEFKGYEVKDWTPLNIEYTATH